MSDVVISAEGLSKRYRIGGPEGQASYRTLRETIVGLATAPVRRFRAALHGHPEAQSEQDVWALRDVSFEVRRGEVVGVIGRNGAGKSTLLKILSGITEPTEGRARVKGRVGSLLEVGTGFHNELTGRENIYLNGAILGMKKAEIARKFDEIVAFSEVERFLDTPVKHYSSGMYMRLAFAVAAHLDPEILLVDEVLAVGDAAFQKKCMGKLGEVAHTGRTVLLVSHNLAAIVNLCERALLVGQGRIAAEGPAGEVVREYLDLGNVRLGERVWADPAEAPHSDKVRLRAVRVTSQGQPTAEVGIDAPLAVEVEFENMRAEARYATSIHLLDQNGVGVLASANFHSANLGRDEWFDAPHPCGRFKVVCEIPGCFLNEGRYSVNAIVLSDVSHIEVYEREVVSFTVVDTGVMRREYAGYWLGVVRPRLRWSTSRLPRGTEEAVCE